LKTYGIALGRRARATAIKGFTTAGGLRKPAVSRRKTTRKAGFAL